MASKGMQVSGTSLDDLVDVGVITKGTIKGEHVTNVGGRAVNLNEMTKKLNKEMKGFEEKNLDIVATASKLRKEYETLYNQLRGLVYPKKKGKLGDK